MPLKEDNYFTLYTQDPCVSHRDVDYYNLAAQIKKDAKIICPTCKHIYDKMFELRLQRLSELSAEINSIYQISSIKNPTERDNDGGRDGKKKK
jgi:predicted nuclease of predicted toxin-antitoxin system